MLARIARQLYWTGRYVARAEHTARVLNGIFGASLQAGRDDAAGAGVGWEAVMAAMGVEPGEDADLRSAAQAVRTLTLDEDAPGSVRWSVESARGSARTIRDVVSREMWEALNTLYLELDETDIGAALQVGPYSIYAFVRERCALWWGLAEETMLRDTAYAFLLAGRHVEEANMMIRSLRVFLAPVSGGDGFVDPEPGLDLLGAVGGVEAYRRSHSIVDIVAGSPAMFLLFERRYPHSLAAALDAAHDRLSEADDGRTTARPILRLARLRAELEFNRGLAIRGEIDTERAAELLADVQGELEKLEAEIETRYFAPSTSRLVISS